MQRYFWIAIGGAIGAILRYVIGVSVTERFGVRFPLGTLIINVSACFIIGLSLEYLSRHAGINPAWRYLIPIGFVGAFSTFSTFEWEAWSSFTTGAFWVGIVYIALSLVAGMIAITAGVAAARSLP